MQCQFRISWIQLIRIYKTHTKYFVIGCDNAETKFKILKIDRTEPKNLIIEEDKAIYSLSEIKEIIERLHAGNSRKKQSNWIQRGLVQTLTAFGIIGFIRFLEGYYMILITKQSVEAELGGHRIYKIEDTSMIYIPNSTVRVSHSDEGKYLKSFQTVDLSSNFYYSNSYDFSNTLQHNICLLHALSMSENENGETNENFPTSEMHAQTNKPVESETSHKRPCPQKLAGSLEARPRNQYVWNKFLKDPIPEDENYLAVNWTVDIIHGFLGQIKINIYGKPVYVTLIARRSSQFAGTRFLKRGCNIHGDVANEVETEQIVHSAVVTSFLHGQYTAYVQHRGSIPVYWYQDINANVVPAKPPIIIALSNPYAQVTARHFSQLFARYGSPIMILNLVRKCERRTHESQLGEAFKAAIDYLDLFLPVDQKIIYQTLDMANLSHSTNSNVLSKLAMLAENSFKQTGFFQNDMHRFEDTLNRNMKWRELKGGKYDSFRMQTGVLRSNCVDCLDRTNSAQFISSKCALAHQLFSLGVIPEPVIEFDTDATRLFEELFEELGDIIALQYGGSQLVHTIQSYRQTAVLASHSRDIVTTLSRYYSNTFSDAFKQSAINLFLGVFKPEDQSCPLWDLLSDNYLHNSQDDIYASFSDNNYTMWLSPVLQSSLPLPHNFINFLQSLRNMEGNKEEIIKFPTTHESIDWFDEFYRTSELTSFDDQYHLNMVDSMTGCLAAGHSNISPFALRADKWQERRNQNEVSDSMSSQSSLEQSSSDEEDITPEMRYKAELFDISTKNYLTNTCTSTHVEREMYGEKISYMPSSSTINMYKRYINVENILSNFIPSSVFSQDSVYYIEPPTVDRQSRTIYEKSVACCTQYPTTPLTSKKIYQEYLA